MPQLLVDINDFFSKLFACAVPKITFPWKLYFSRNSSPLSQVSLPDGSSKFYTFLFYTQPFNSLEKGKGAKGSKFEYQWEQPVFEAN